MTDKTFSERVVLLVDLNAFFASVEQAANPRLQGKPIAIIGSGRRNVILTSSYEARAFGVKTGMTVWEGKKCCPHLMLIVADNRKYTTTSRRIMKLLERYTPAVEVFSIDEAFLDISGSYHLFGTPELLARDLKKRMYRQFGLTCSVGIAPNKLLAKLGADLQKPDGLVIITPERISELLEPLPVGEMFGIGKKMVRHLAGYGISTCGELARFPVAVLRKRFGINGERIHRIALGIDDSPVVPLKENNEIKSISHGTTFDYDIDEPGELRRQIRRLAEMVGRRARKHQYSGKTVSLGIRYKDFSDIHRQHAHAAYMNQGEEIYRVAVYILDTIPWGQPVRHTSVTLSQLRKGSRQPGLFGPSHKKLRTTAAMDRINDEYGECTVTQGRLLYMRKHARVIAPAYRPAGPHKVEIE